MIKKNETESVRSDENRIFDSGIGGMTVLYEAIKVLPYEDYIFYADTLNVPYGENQRVKLKNIFSMQLNFWPVKISKLLLLRVIQLLALR